MMTPQEQKKFDAGVKRILKEVSRSRKAARAFLVGAGIVTPKGNLRKPYRNLRFPLPPLSSPDSSSK